MVSFDVVSLFTSIPVDKACTYIRTKLENDDTLSDRTQLDIDDILRLLQFVLSNSFFVYNDISLLRRGFKDFPVFSNASALDDKHFSSNSGDPMRGRGDNEIPHK